MTTRIAVALVLLLGCGSQQPASPPPTSESTPMPAPSEDPDAGAVAAAAPDACVPEHIELGDGLVAIKPCHQPAAPGGECHELAMACSRGPCAAEQKASIACYKTCDLGLGCPGCDPARDDLRRCEEQECAELQACLPSPPNPLVRGGACRALADACWADPCAGHYEALSQCASEEGCEEPMECAACVARFEPLARCMGRDCAALGECVMANW